MQDSGHCGDDVILLVSNEGLLLELLRHLLVLIGVSLHNSVDINRAMTKLHNLHGLLDL